MLLRFPGLLLAAGLLAGLPAAHAQRAANDGFRRLNGQMQVVRNGQPRPMTRDATLPTGATVTKDGFVVAANGQRTELAEGQGCDLRGRPVAVRTGPTGALTLAAPGPARPAAATPTVLEQFFGPGKGGGFFKHKKAKKHHGKGKGHGHGDD